MVTKEKTKYLELKQSSKNLEVQFNFSLVNPAFVSDTKKPKIDQIICGTCHCSGNTRTGT
jgi:hypothetical protein